MEKSSTDILEKNLYNIGSIFLVAWKHPQLSDTFISRNNNIEVGKALDGYPKYSVLFDTIAPFGFRTEINRSDEAYMIIRDFFINEFQDKDRLVLGGDFRSLSRGFNDELKKSGDIHDLFIYKIPAVAAGLGAFALFKNKLNKKGSNVRRSFISSILGGLGFGMISNVLEAIAIDRSNVEISSKLNKNNLDDPRLKLIPLTISKTLEKYNIVSTGISIAKHNYFLNNNELSKFGFSNAGALQVWGTSHFGDSDFMKKIKYVSENPTMFAESMIEEESNYLKGLGKDKTEIINSLAFLRFAMGSLAVLKPKAIDKGIEFEQVGETLFYDEIIGFNTKDMSSVDVFSKIEVDVNEVYNLRHND